MKTCGKRDGDSQSLERSELGKLIGVPWEREDCILWVALLVCMISRWEAGFQGGDTVKVGCGFLMRPSPAGPSPRTLTYYSGRQFPSSLESSIAPENTAFLSHSPWKELLNRT